MAQLFKNNARSTLAASLASGATSLSVATGEGARFPALSGSDTFVATIEDSTNVEIVLVTARSGDSFTVTREQEGTTSPATFASGSVISLRLTAAAIEPAVNHVADTTAAHAASAISNTPSGNLAATDVQAALDELQTDIDTRATATALTDHTGDTTAAHAASAISNTPSGSIAATDVQAALNELDTEKQPLDADLTALAGLSTTGYATRTGAGTWALRTFLAGTGISITDATGETGNTTIGAVAASETASGVVELATSAETAALVDTGRAIVPANLSAGVKAAVNASGSAPVYSCRAWINFNGTGTPAARGSGNVSSITDNGTGNYTLNFTTALEDANYAIVVGGIPGSNGTYITAPFIGATAATVNGCNVVQNPTGPGTGGMSDPATFCVSIFR